jgi:hypothetical protein
MNPAFVLDTYPAISSHGRIPTAWANEGDISEEHAFGCL